MKIKTNISWNSLAKYSAMMWNNGEDGHVANGDTLADIIENEDDSFILTSEFLEKDCEWVIENAKSLLEEDFCATCHYDFKHGKRDDETVAGHKQYLVEMKRIKRFEADFHKWLNSSVETVDTWEYDIDDVLFVEFPDGVSAVPILK